MNHDTTASPFLTFRLEDQHYALPIENVVEVAAMVALIHTADPDPALLGMANRHETVLPMLDLRVMLDHPAAPITASTLFIVVTYEAHLFGLVVDEIFQVEYLPTAQNSIRGIISYDKRLIQIVTLNTLLTTYVG